MPTRARSGSREPSNGGGSVPLAMQSEREAEQELQLYRDLFVLNQHGIIVGNPDGQTIGRCNPAFARMLGYARPEELEGAPIAKIFPAEQLPVALAAIERAHERGHHQYETVMLGKDGRSVTVLVDLTAVRDDAGN